MNLLLKFLFIIFFSVVLTGCALLKGTPAPPINISDFSEAIETELKDATTTPATSAPDTKEKRNKLMNKAFILIDLRYQEFVNHSGFQHRVKTMASEFTQLSLNLAGTAVGGAGLKTLLAALSAGISGTNLAFEKTFIYESTVPALIMQMNADRSVIRNQILRRMEQNNDQYTWEAAAHDLIEYYNAGTLQSAISSIKKNAGAIEKQMENEIVEIKNKNLATPDDVLLKKRLTNAILSNSDSEKEKGILMPLSQKLSHLPACKKLDSISSNERAAIIGCIREAGTGSKTAADDLGEFQSIFSTAGLISNP